MRPFNSAIYGKFHLFYLCQFRLFFWSVHCTVLVCKLCHLFQTILDLWPVLILEVFNHCDIKKGLLEFLLTLLTAFFWSVNLMNQVCKSSHIFDMGIVLFGDLQYLVFQLLGFLMMMMNCFCGMVDRRKAFSLISNRDHCQRSSQSRISDTPSRVWTCAEPEFRLSSNSWNVTILVCKLNFYFWHV